MLGHCHVAHFVAEKIYIVFLVFMSTMSDVPPSICCMVGDTA